MQTHDSRDGSIITVLNLKGGVGKTHTVWLFAGVCQERKRSLLAIDLDTQGNLTRSLLPEFDGRHGVEALFDPASDTGLRDLICKTLFDHIDVVPASSALSRFDRSNQQEWEKGDLQWSLAEALNEVRGDYDAILLDCPPRLSLASFAALCASDFLIIPLEAADWGAQGITQVAQAAEYVQRRFNPNLELLGYLVSRFKRARAFQWSYLKQLRQHFGKLAFDTVVPDLARYEKSVTVSVPITLYAPASIEAGIARRLFAEVQRRIGRSRRRRAGGRGQDVRSKAGAGT